MADTTPTMLAWGISTTHVILALAILLLLFGGKKLPELAKGIGKGLRIFRDEFHGIQKDIDETPANPPTSTPQDKPPVEAEKK